MTAQDTYPFVVELAANHLGCRPDELIKWRMEGELLVVIAPDGRKYKYTVDQVKAMAAELPQSMVTHELSPAGDIDGGASPMVTPPAVGQAPTAGENAGSSPGEPSPKKAAKRPSRK